MKYWSFFAAKLAGVAAVLISLWWAIERWMPTPEPVPYLKMDHPFGYDLWWTLAVFVYWLIAAGLLSLTLLDQRYRCRTCLRRLRMPVSTGSWPNSFLIGPPKMEYICLYGHGTLQVPELQISGPEKSGWEAHGDIWQELSAADRDR